MTAPISPFITRLPLLGLLFLATAPLLTAGSIEKVPATTEDLAHELGLELDKFEAKFDTPVYATVRLAWKQPGAAEAKALEHTSPDPEQDHQILFVRKDFGRMQLKTGGDNAKKVKDVIEMNVRFGKTGFFYRDMNPFASLKEGESFHTWSKQQSREPLPLDEAIPLLIVAGPSTPGKPPKNLKEEFGRSPAYIALSVTFSRKAPAPAATTAPGNPAAPAPASKPQ